MTHSSRPIVLLVLLHWLGSSLASNPLDLLPSEASGGEVPAVIRNTELLFQRPVLQPKETAPPTFTYTLRNLQGKVCIRASLGVEYMVKENKKKYYFNFDPRSTRPTGYCGDKKSVLSLDVDGAQLKFTFIKDKDFSYVKTIEGLLKPASPCKNCKNASYTGSVDNKKLFKAKNGLSFSCKSETSLQLASSFLLKLVPLQIQAFDLPAGDFGKVVECSADYNKKVIPIALGAAAAAVCLIAVLTYVLVRERRTQAYERL